MTKVRIQDISNYKDISDSIITYSIGGNISYLFAGFEDSVGLIREILKDKNVTVGSIDISRYEYNFYDKEYYISLDYNMVLDVEPAYQTKNEWHNSGYSYFDANILIIGDNTNYCDMIKDLCSLH